MGGANKQTASPMMKRERKQRKEGRGQENTRGETNRGTSEPGRTISRKQRSQILLKSKDRVSECPYSWYIMAI
jgi:hypothetical protein